MKGHDDIDERRPKPNQIKNYVSSHYGSECKLCRVPVKDLEGHLQNTHGMDKEDYEAFMKDVQRKKKHGRPRKGLKNLLAGTLWASLLIMVIGAFLYVSFVFDGIPFNEFTEFSSYLFAGVGSALIIKDEL